MSEDSEPMLFLMLGVHGLQFSVTPLAVFPVEEMMESSEAFFINLHPNSRFIFP